MSDDLISRKAVIESVDRHTRDDGTLDDDISVILEEVETAFDKETDDKEESNADRIRSMTDEELAKFIESVQCYGHGWCEKCSSMNGDYCNGMRANEPDEGILEWLKQPVED